MSGQDEDQGLGASPLRGDRVTDERSLQEQSPPSGSVPTGASFTPGPWLAETNEKSACVSIYGPRGDGNVRQSDGLGRLVTVECATEPDAVMFSPMNEEDVANARLFAAAPDLLVALVELVERNIKRGPFDEPLGESEQEPEINRALAAIAKAKGKQP